MQHASHLDQHDVVYLSPADGGYNGMPIGNGDVGAMVWTEAEKLIWTVNKCDLWDDGPAENFGCWDSDREENWTTLRSGCRLTISNSLPAYDRTYLADFEQRLDLHQAAVHLNARTPFAQANVETFVDAATRCLVVRYEDETEEPAPRTISLSRWGSRAFAHWYIKILRDPTIGLAGTESRADGRTAIIEQQTRSLRFAIACRIGRDGDGRWERLHAREVRCRLDPGRTCRLTLYLSIVTSEEAEDPVQQVIANVDAAEAAGLETIRRGHHERWREFWARSFIDIPDKYLENLWYLNLYLLGASSTGRYPPVNNSLLWTWNRDIRAWNHYYHWNNHYHVWPVFTAGHPELARGYLDMAYRALDNARADARRYHDSSGALYADVVNRRGYQDPGSDDPLAYPYAYQNLTVGAMLALDCWQHYRFSGDEAFLRERGYPIMTAACQLYLDLLRREEDGLYHLPGSHPYEHPGQYLVRDCITDLSAIKTLFPVTAQAADTMGDWALAAKLREVVEHLVGFECVALPACFAERDSTSGGDGDSQGSGGKVVYRNGKVTGQPVDDPRMISAGRRVSDGAALFGELSRDPALDSPDLFPTTMNAPLFPFHAVSLKDRGTDLFSAARTTILAHWTDAVLGFTLQPVSFARLGMGEQAYEAIRDTIGQFQQFRQGLWTEYRATPAPVDELAANLRSPGTWDAGKTPAVLRDCDIRWPLGIDVSRDTTSVDRRCYVRVINADDECVWFPSAPVAHVAQTPGGAVQVAVNEMLLQSHDGVIRVAPAVPGSWTGAFGLWAQGGLKITARFERGAVCWLVVEPRHDGPCRFENPWHAAGERAEVVALRDNVRAEHEADESESSFSARAGESYLVYPASRERPDPTLEPRPERKRREPRYACGRWIGIDREF